MVFSLERKVPVESKCLIPRNIGSLVSDAAFTSIVASSTELTYSNNKKSTPVSARITDWSRNSLYKSSEIIFVCLPTPMKENGECDIGIVKKEIEKINKYSTHKKIVVIKSTVPPDTTKKINNSNKNIDVIFNPEFLTERNFIEDFKKQNRIVLGGNQKPVDILQQVYGKVFPNITIVKTDSTTAEMIKYMNNCFFATKVSFMNEMKFLCDTIGANWEHCVEGFALDGRIGHTHLSVPGHDGKFGDTVSFDRVHDIVEDGHQGL